MKYQVFYTVACTLLLYALSIYGYSQSTQRIPRNQELQTNPATRETGEIPEDQLEESSPERDYVASSTIAFTSFNNNDYFYTVNPILKFLVDGKNVIQADSPLGRFVQLIALTYNQQELSSLVLESKLYALTLINVQFANENSDQLAKLRSFYNAKYLNVSLDTDIIIAAIEYYSQLARSYPFIYDKYVYDISVFMRQLPTEPFPVSSINLLIPIILDELEVTIDTYSQVLFESLRSLGPFIKSPSTREQYTKIMSSLYLRLIN